MADQPMATESDYPDGANPFLNALGVQTLRADSEGSELLLTLADWHMNRWAIAHGGVTMTLLDAALGKAAREIERPPGYAGNDRSRGVVTVDMSVTFIQPGQGSLTARGRVVHRSTTMAFCEGEVVDADGGLVAKALGTFKYLRKLPLGRKVRAERREGPVSSSEA
ncbi:PaaI family thioesterase [Robbsia sp. KACC 23696]|uniref:PaaI family thioesterase n=1 Tax=Robbsia sp. KACC 23696 TaxID=3149231 RepID=UPI00325BC32D